VSTEWTHSITEKALSLVSIPPLAELYQSTLSALQLADRVMMIGGLASCLPDLRGWTVQITDECQHSVMNVMFSAVSEKRRAADHFDGARASQERVATRWYQKTFVSRSELKPIHPVSRSPGRQCRRATFGNRYLKAFKREIEAVQV
jgi:hypothetical protein